MTKTLSKANPSFFIHLRHVTAFLLALFLCVCSFGGQAYAAGAPDITSVQSRENALALMNAYDKDGSYLAKSTLSGDNFYNALLLFYINGGDRAIDTLDTIEHESFHEFAIPTYTDGKGYPGGERIYVGSKKSINVPITKVFRTVELADTIPARCRSTHYHYSGGDRFKTYILDESGVMLTDWDGVYGLLNEFGGYCWGMNSTVSMYKYRDKYEDTFETWSSFITDGENNRLAYAEFKYFILHYLRYAKEHEPKVYKQILANARFCKAYRMIDERFAKEIKEYETQLDSVLKKLKTAGHPYSTKKLVLRKQYNVMIKEIKKAGYQEIQKKIAK